MNDALTSRGLPSLRRPVGRSAELSALGTRTIFEARVWMSLSRQWLVVAQIPAFALMLACGRTAQSSVEVINTSGSLQVVQIGGPSDSFWQDTLSPGSTSCWPVPPYARTNGMLLVTVSLADTVSLSHDYTTSWSGSFESNLSRRVQIHVPTPLDGSPDWEAYRERRIKVADSLFAGKRGSVETERMYDAFLNKGGTWYSRLIS